MTTYAPETTEIADDSPESLAALFDTRGWGDGLPLVAPTPARVDAMLAEATGDPDEVIATLLPRAGIVTRRVVAINAVLAGCPDAVFPVVLTAVRALAQPEMNLRGVNATTHLVAPMVHRPRRDRGDRGVQRRRGRVRTRQPRQRDRRSRGAAGPAPRRRRRPGFGDAATHGQPAKYTFCAAENLAESPWEGYARSRGVDAPSAVTVHCGEGPHNVHDMEKDGDPQLILDKIASAMTSLGHEQRADQPGRVLRDPRARARGQPRRRRLLPRGRVAVPLRPGTPPGRHVPPPLRGAGVGAVDEDRPGRPRAAR